MSGGKTLAALSAALLLSVSSLALAQDAGERRQGGSQGGGQAERSAQPPAGEQKAPAAATPRSENKGEARRETPAAGKSEGTSGSAKPSDDRAPRAAQKRDAEQPRAQEQGRSERDRGVNNEGGAKADGKAARDTNVQEPRRASDRGNDRANEKAAPSSGKASDSEATRSRQNRSATDAGPNSSAKSGDSRRGSDARAPGAGSGASTGTGEADRTQDRAGREQQRLTDQQRIVIRDRLGSDRRGRRSANVNVRVQIGSPLPRGVALAVLPPVIVQEVPEYRGYRYAVVEDEIVIVEPRSNRVVEVIERRDGARAASGGGNGSRDLRLSEAEQRIVYEAVIADFEPVDARVRLGLGATVPRRVELDRFPRRVVDQVPQLKNFRFVIVDKEVVVVEPRNREIVLVIDG